MAGIQRHEALLNLSRHHHHALVVAMHLKRANSHNLHEIKQEVMEFWNHGGNAHFREEEEILLPTYAKYKNLQADENVIRMLLEHVQIRMYVQAVKNDEAKVETFHDFGVLLKGHIQLEEQVIFAEIQSTVAEPDLLAIQQFFHELE